MNGRVEQENKIFTSLELKLKDYPNFVYFWYISLRASDCRATTCRDYIKKIGKFLEYLYSDIKDSTPSDISYENVSRYLISIKYKKDSNENIVATSDSYQQTVWCCFNNLVSFLVEQKLIEENFMKRIKKPKNRDLARINNNRILLDDYDFRKILKSVEDGCGSDKAHSFQERMKNRDMAMMLILMSTGMRESALLSINLTDVDFEKGELSVIDKGDIWHTYNLTDGTIRYLEDWVEDRRKIATNEEALFVSYKGKRMSPTAISKLVRKYSKDALGYEISPHKLRAGFCSIMYSKTGDAFKVSRMVGHANIATTQRYIVTKRQEREEAKEIMSEIFW